MNILTGLLVLAFCLIVSQVLSLSYFKDNDFFLTISQAFGILGSVALWDPGTFFLYGWRENSREFASYIKLAISTINVVFDKAGTNSNNFIDTDVIPDSDTDEATTDDSVINATDTQPTT